MNLQNERVLNLFQSRKAHTLKHHAPFFNHVARRYDLYRGNIRTPFTAGFNHVTLPSIFGIIQSDVSKKVQALLGGDKFVEFTARNSTDGSFARKVTALVNSQLHDCQTTEKGQDFFLTADMYGTAFAKHGWKTVRRMAQFRKLDEQTQREMIVEGVVTKFDGPDWDVLDILDVWPQPGRRRLQDCRWVMVRYFMDLDELTALDSVGLYEKGAVAQLKATNGPTGFVEDAYNNRRYLYRNLSDYNARNQERFNKLVECVDMYGYVPDGMATDGFDFRFITVANDRVVLRNKPFPLFHGDIPILSYSPMADPHYIHGVGKIEITERLQYIANRWMSQKADAVDLTVAPMWLVNRQAGIEPGNLYTRAGRVIGVDGPVGDETIRPVPFDLRGFPVVDNEISRIFYWIQHSTGSIGDVSMGEMTGKEQTATEFGGRAQGAMSRQEMELLLAGKMWLEPLANYFHENNRQFLRLPAEVMMIGEDAMTDPITGLAQAPTSASVGLADLHKDYRAVATGAGMLGIQQKQANVFALNSQFQQNPVALQAINWVAWLRYAMTVFGIPNTKDFFNQENVPGVNQVASATGASPQGIADIANGAAPMLDLLGGAGG